MQLKRLFIHRYPVQNRLYEHFKRPGQRMEPYTNLTSVHRNDFNVKTFRLTNKLKLNARDSKQVRN